MRKKMITKKEIKVLMKAYAEEHVASGFYCFEGFKLEEFYESLVYRGLDWPCSEIPSDQELISIYEDMED